MRTSYIDPSAIIFPGVEIGKGVTIGPLCIIGAPPEWKGHEAAITRVVIADGATLTGLVTVDAGTKEPTYIGEGAYLMKHSHVGHDAVICDGVTISCGAKIGGHCIIGRGTNIGLNAVIHQKVVVPEGCMIGASAFVGKTSVMKPFRKYAGVPIKDIGENSGRIS